MSHLPKHLTKHTEASLRVFSGETKPTDKAANLLLRRAGDGLLHVAANVQTSPDAWARDPRLVWEFYSMRRRVAAGAKANPAHSALAKVEEKLSERLFLCTQNVDNLHEQAGSKRVVHMHGELFQSRCDSCSRPPFEDANTYEPPTDLPRCEYGGGIRPHICWFGETPFELDKIFRALDRCTVFTAIGTSGVVEPAASFVAQVRGRARTIYVGPEEPANAFVFTECHLGKAGEVLPRLFN